MNVLSLFDGCGMAYQAMKNIDMNVEKYYASEIDKYAIQICKKNHPDVIQLGDIKNISGKDFDDIDLIIGGYPCQPFSNVGKRLNFDDPRGQLFFHAKRIIDEIKPKYFILENVASMRKDIQNEISRILGVEPIMINASLVSAQNRRRLFWTNISEIEQPEDKRVYFKDILENEVDEKYYLSEKVVSRLKIGDLERCGVAGYKITGKERDKATTLLSRDYKGMQSRDFNIVIDKHKIRKLTPIECERLQCLPDNYTESVSDTQRYKMLGNGFNVKVIEHILKFIYA